MTKKFALAKEEIRERMREQLAFLLKSARDYDAGDEAEARRMAASLHMLLHQEGRSKAILSQLGLRDSISFLDTCGPLTTTNLLTDNPMVRMRMETTAKGTLTRFIPRLGEEGPVGGPHRKLPFGKWWNMPVIRSPQANVTFTRRELVVAVRNQDGGGHVDAELEMAYARLTRLNEFGWEMLDGTHKPIGPIRAIELAHIRQITYEVLVSLATNVSYTGIA